MAPRPAEPGWHPAAWREPDARPRELFTAAYWADLAREAEAGVLDYLTIEDSLGIQSADWSGDPGDRTSQVRGRLDAVLVAARIAPLTRAIGLIPTASTTHTEPAAAAGAARQDPRPGRGRPPEHDDRARRRRRGDRVPGACRHDPGDVQRAVRDRPGTRRGSGVDPVRRLPATVVKHLRVLRDATRADELLVTTITHEHADRVRSFGLLAREWGQA